MQHVELAVSGGFAALVEFVEIAVEAEQRAEHGGIEEIHQRMQLVDAVLDGRAGQHEGVAALEALDGLARLGVPILDALRLVEHHHVGPQARVDIQGVAHHLLEVGHREKRRVVAVAGQAGVAFSVHELVGQRGEALDLLFPLALERGGRDGQHATRLAQPVEQRAGGDGLDRLAEAHLVGQQGAFGEGEVEHPLALVGKERRERLAGGPLAVVDLLLVLAPQGQALRRASARFQKRRDQL